ncbi:TnsA endonuclease-like protein [Paraburkholderia tropica]|uniref:TnsA endonuclease-like protein n=1 Tax=Paraburkholderia tropica TaxID=92647 RepID=A0ABX5MC33_9BURK|nr:TnsA endonuclease-like protein [Paraburkholderia tropica]PZW70520.1 TnsA endonuclease-like protein [Paraburkholderia tropica]QNB17592.1 heteromeric transposase endonuclease subunit TnsA [Paraburkholderia tropica]
MRARRFRTQQDIERYVAQGYGQGVGADYKPWLRVQDVPSRGRSRKVHGLKTGRVHHVLSDLEYRYLVALEFSERVVDIREQFPLLPVAPIQDAARLRSIRYPLYAGTTVPFVMTSDFVVTVKEGDGSVREIARTVKYADELTPGSRLSRTLEKLELERAFWAQRDVDWKLVTETSMSATKASNLIWLRGGAEIARELRDNSLQTSFVEGIAEAGTHDRTLSSLLRTVSYRLRMPYPDAVRLFRHMVWHKVLLVDLETPMKATLRAPLIQVAADGPGRYKQAA